VRVGRSFVAATLLVVLVANGSLAQRIESLAVGSRLRVRAAPHASWEYGLFRNVVRDSLELTVTDTDVTRRYALADLESIETYQVRERAATDHALIGALAGLVVGSAALVIDVKHCEATSRHSEGPPCGLGYTMLPIVAFGGAAVGATAGALWPVRHWGRVKLRE